MTHWAIDQLYVATATRPLGDQQEQTGFFKQPLVGTAKVDENGIVGDIQADQYVHGGPEKALHQYALASYLLMHRAFPQLTERLVAGSMGENISAAGMHEYNVHIGDIFRAGNVTIQVSQPRQPCWKINSRFGDAGLVKFIVKTYSNGWYYRVLDGGEVRAGDSIMLVERGSDLSVYNFLRINGDHQPDKIDLRRIRDCPGLNPDWQKKLQQRYEALYD